MTVLEVVALYYDAWQNKRGDFSEVPLADDFEFIGPVASFDNAEGYRTMAAEAGQAVTSFAVRRQFVDGNTVPWLGMIVTAKPCAPLSTERSSLARMQARPW